MTLFRRLAVAALIATYFLIFVGALVRVSGAGLGCPDWPHCFGRWIPPTNVSQLPPDMDPSDFNFVLAWIEYVNRLIGVIVGLLIAAVGITAIAKYRKQKNILIASIVAAILVAYQGWQGGQVVSSALEPLIVSAHMGIAFIIVSLLLYITYHAYNTSPPPPGQDVYPPRMRLWSGILWLAVLIQVVLGTQIRSAVETAAEKYPLFSPEAWLDEAGMYGYVHSILGITIATAGWFIAARVLGASSNPSPLVHRTSWALMVLVFVQTIFGIVLYTGGLPPVVQVLHVWLAAIITGLTLLLYVATKPVEAAP